MLVDIWKTLVYLYFSKYYDVVVLYFPLYHNKKLHCYKTVDFTANMY